MTTTRMMISIWRFPEIGVPQVTMVVSIVKRSNEVDYNFFAKACAKMMISRGLTIPKSPSFQVSEIY